MVEVQDFKNNPGISRRIYLIYLISIKKNWKMSIVNQLDLDTLGSQMIMPKNLHAHCLLGYETHD